MTNYTLYARSFRGLLLRDISVLRREVIPFLIRTVMNPLMFVFVFTYLFPKMGQGFQNNAGASFGTLILPGLLAVGIFIQGIMATALPLSMEIGATREIHDRVMSPLPVTWVAIEKIVFSAVQSLLAALVIFPLVYFIPATPVQVHVSSWATLIGILILASLVAGTVGLGDRHSGEAGTNRADVRHHRGAGDVLRLRVLPVGRDVQGAMAADPGADQSAGVHERGIAHRTDAGDPAHARMGGVSRVTDRAGSVGDVRGARIYQKGTDLAVYNTNT